MLMPDDGGAGNGSDQAKLISRSFDQARTDLANQFQGSPPRDLAC